MKKVCKCWILFAFYIFMNMKYFRRRIKHTITQYMKNNWGG